MSMVFIKKFYMKNQMLGLLALAFVFNLYPQAGSCATIPKQGENLPEISFPAPDLEKDKAYLGVNGKESFSIKDLDSQLIVLEIIGVYCPVCHVQRPHLNRLFHRINKNADLSGKIKFLAVAAGGTPMEVAYYVKESKVPYPVLQDEDFILHKKISEPLTPYTLVITRDGKIVYAHLGLIDDMDKFFVTLKDLADKPLPIPK